MIDKTTIALAESFRALASTKSVDDITIQEICDHAGKSRMTFYYHFKDISELMDWTFNDKAQKIMSKHTGPNSWQDAIAELVAYVYDDRPLMMSVYNSVSYDAMEKSLNDIISAIIKEVLTNEHLDTLINSQESKFLITLFTHGLTGLCMDWVRDGLKEDPKIITKQLELALAEFLKGSVIILNIIDKK